MLSNLQVILLFVYLIMENLKKVFLCHLAMGNIIVSCIIIIFNTWNKITNYMEIIVIKD